MLARYLVTLSIFSVIVLLPGLAGGQLRRGPEGFHDPWTGEAQPRAGAGDRRAAPDAGAVVPDVTAPLDVKRQFVLRTMLAEFRNNPGAHAEISAKVAAMDPQRIDQLLEVYGKRAAHSAHEAEAQRRQALADSPAYRQARLAQWQAARAAQNAAAAARPAAARPVVYGPRPGVGYAPIITWLSEGTSMGASAVVSPDRRYVRINAQPFFSYIPQVDTFNFYTGKTRTIYPQPPRDGGSDHGTIPQQWHGTSGRRNR